MIFIKIKKTYKFLFVFLICGIILIFYNKDKFIDFSSKEYVYPAGSVIGIKAKTNGVLVLGSEENVKYIDSIYEGDIILSIENQKINNSQDISDILNKLKKDYVNVTFKRDDEIITKSIKTKEDEGYYKLGFWVRDKVSAIATMTCYNPEKNTFYAMGHPIYDSDIKKILTIKQGDIYNSSNLKILKGTKCEVGEIKDNSDFKHVIGNFYQNSNYGIKGTLSNKYFNEKNKNLIEVGNYKKIKKGKAQILFQYKDNSIRTYDILISKIDLSNKVFEIEVVDKDLIEYTGGIIRGMSGCPIIQNERLVGSIAYVFNNNPKKGFGIFIEEMVK